MKPQEFFNEIENTLFNGTLSEKQRQGINYKLKAFDTHDIIDDRWRAYMLATSYHETARTMQPIEEKGRGARKRYGQTRKYNGEVYVYPDKLYYGRGDVQLTWYENYELMGKLLNIPLLEQPELALDPDISAKIMIEGMTRGRSNRGDFTGVSLENYFNLYKEDPFNARKIINGLDCAMLIEEYYGKFLSALKNSRIMLFLFVINLLFVLGGCKPKQLVNEHVVNKLDSSAIWQLNDSIQIKEWQMSVLKSHLNRFIEDNFNLVSEMWKREIYYDTNAAIDSVSGRHPVLGEIVTTNIITLENSLKNHEALIKEDSIVKINVSKANRNIELKVEKVIDKNKTIESKRFHKTSWKYILTVLCVILLLFFTRNCYAY